MRLYKKSFLFTVILTGMYFLSVSQSGDVNPFQEIPLNPNKVIMFEKFVRNKHQTQLTFEDWKAANTMLYVKEMWYYSESFYVKRNQNANGFLLNEGAFDVSRFESRRSETEEVIINVEGSKDVMVLLPLNKLIYKPQ